MPQPRIDQITGLTLSLSTKFDTVVYGDTSAGYAQIASKAGTTLTFASLLAGTGIIALANTNNRIAISLNVGVGANQIPQLDPNGRLGPIDGSQLINLSPASFTNESGATFPLTTLALGLGQFYIGNAFGNPIAVNKNTISLSGFGTPATTVDLGSQIITTAATSFTDNALVTKLYVNSVLQGASYKSAAVVAPTTNIDITNPPAEIDGITLNASDRVLLMNQTNSSQNGVYDFHLAGNLMTRSADCSTAIELNQMAIYVSEGYNAYSSFLMITPPPLTVDGVGATGLQYTQISSAGQISAGAGLSKSGSSLLLNGDNTTVKAIGGAASVVSSNVVGQVLLSTGFNSQAAAWGPLSLNTSGAITGTLPTTNGGTGLSAIAVNAIPAALTANTFTGVVINASSLLGRTSMSGVQSMSENDVKTVLQVRPIIDTGHCTAGSMALITLSQTPSDSTKIVLYFNGVVLTYNTDYFVSGQTISASNSLNIAYGGATNDGNGFATTDTITAVYTY